MAKSIAVNRLHHNKYPQGVSKSSRMKPKLHISNPLRFSEDTAWGSGLGNSDSAEEAFRCLSSSIDTSISAGIAIVAEVVKMLQPNVSGSVNVGAAVPEGFGSAIPSNSHDLLQFIKRQKLSKQSGSALRSCGPNVGQTGDLAHERLKMLDEQREQLELRMMYREDEISSNLTLLFKEYDYNRFRAKLVKQVEIREAQEKAEREAKRIAAEERRKAVVERIRRQEELAEQRKREAELALLRIKEAKERHEQWERDRLASDLAQMPLEDQLSALAEQDFREILERKLWQERERAKLVAWEAEQREKDKIEEEKRQARMSELDEKRKKLDLLRQQQSKVQKPSDAAMKEEAERLNKQLRIQNKAKFVTRRMNAAPIPDETIRPSTKVEETKVESAPITDGIQRTHDAAAMSSDHQSSEHLHVQTAASSSKPVVTEQADAEFAQYSKDLLALDDLEQLRDRLHAFSQEKRALRLEQRQRLVSASDGPSVQEQLRRIERRSCAVEERIKELQQASPADKQTGSESEKSSVETQQTNSLSSGAVAPSEEPLKPHVSAQTLRLQQKLSMSSTSSAKQPQGSNDDLLRAVDHILRESQRLCDNAEQISMQEVSSMLMQISSLEKKIAGSSLSSSSVLLTLGYSDRLQHMQQRLRSLLKHVQTQQASPETKSTGGNSSVLVSSSRPSSSKGRDTDKDSSRIKERHAGIPSSTGIADAHSRPASSKDKNKSQDADGNREQVVRIDQDLHTLNTHTQALRSSSSAPQLSPRSSSNPPATASSPATSTPTSTDRKPTTAEATGASAATNDAVKDEEEEEEEDPEQLAGWHECINSSLFFSAAHHAAYFGYLDVLRFLCKYFDCFIMDDKRRTPLFYAALNNQLACLALLLSLDPRWIDVGDHVGDTALHAAAMSSNKGGSSDCEVLAFLLSCEAHPDTANHAGLTPSHVAQSVSALRLLQKHKAQLFCMDHRSRLPLWHACRDRRVDCLEYLLQQTPRSFILWPDENEGDTCVHIAAKQGHVDCLETLLRFLFASEDSVLSGEDALYVTNKRQYTAAHCAAHKDILRVLYEYGMNLFVADAKEHMPLFLMAFYNRLDCLAYLLDVASSPATALPRSTSSKATFSFDASSSTPSSVASKVAHADQKGDTALHVACVAGHYGAVQLLLFFLSNRLLVNKQGFKPSDLARKAGHAALADLVERLEEELRPSDSSSGHSVVGVTASEQMHSVYKAFETYGSRWTKCYDAQYMASYYYDHVTQQAHWTRPPTCDLLPQDERDFDLAQDLLTRFYTQHNATKLAQLNDILFLYRRRYTELFITLAQRYEVQDLKMFEGVQFFDGASSNTSLSPRGAPPQQKSKQ